jgi:PII-like signaling protein
MELMNLSGQVKRLVVVVGESDRVYQRPLFEAIVYAAKKYKIAGATVTRGTLSYGSESMIHSSKIFALSDDAPVIIVFVDVDERLRDFSQIINRLIDKAGAGGLMTIEDVEVLRYGDNHE